MKKVKFTAVILLLVLPILAFSQTITTNPLSKNELCYDEDFQVSYVVNGIFNSDNVFIVQLSNNDFTNFINIGKLKSTSSGTIDAKIPKEIETSEKYRIRVISSSPYIAGSDNGSDIKIYGEMKPILIQSLAGSFFQENENTIFYLTDNKGNKVQYEGEWNFGEEATPANFYGIEPPPIIYNTSGLKNIRFIFSKKPLCYPYSDTLKTQIYVADCNAKIDSNAIVDSIPISYTFLDAENEKFGIRWVLPTGAVNSYMIYNTIFFVETGGSVEANFSRNSIYILKNGASLKIIDGGNISLLVIREPAASISIRDSVSPIDTVTIIECPNISFLYSTAPKKGIEILQKLGYLSVEEETSPNISLAPNPALDYIEINLARCPTLSKCRTSEIRIYNTLGECVITVETQHAVSLQRIDVSHLPAGVYYIISGKQTRMFVKL